MKTSFLVQIFKNQKGLSIVEASIAGGMLAAGALALASMGGNSNKQNNTVEFKLSVEQYRMQTMTQFLATTKNCQCLFKNIEMPKEPASRIVEVGAGNSADLGIYKDDCSAIPQPYLKASFGPDGIRAKSIKLTDVDYVSGSYYGNLAVELETKKDVYGNPTRGFKVPITLKTEAAMSPTQVKISSCGLSGSDGDESPLKVPQVGAAGWTLPATSGNFSFPGLPSTASGVFIQYTIGSPSNGRADRNCDIMGTGVAVKLGNDSKGDGGQRFVAGSAYIPLDGCSTPMKYNCVNKNGAGELRVVSYVDDGNAPSCSGVTLNCNPATEVLEIDAVNGPKCVPKVDDTPDCGAGTYNDTTDSCDCNSGAIKIGNSCINI